MGGRCHVVTYRADLLLCAIVSECFLEDRQLLVYRGMVVRQVAAPTTLAADLLDETDNFQDFVVAHELLHLRVPNHGRLFKALMTAHVPGWRSPEVSRSNRAAH